MGPPLEPSGLENTCEEKTGERDAKRRRKSVNMGDEKPASDTKITDDRRNSDTLGQHTPRGVGNVTQTITAGKHLGDADGDPLLMVGVGKGGDNEVGQGQDVEDAKVGTLDYPGDTNTDHQHVDEVRRPAQNSLDKERKGEVGEEREGKEDEEEGREEEEGEEEDEEEEIDEERGPRDKRKPPQPLGGEEVGDDELEDDGSESRQKSEHDETGTTGRKQAAERYSDVAIKPGSTDGKGITRARSAWMIFLAENRGKVRKENPNMAIGPMQKILSDMWKALGKDEVARFNQMAADEKARMQRELQEAGLTRLPAKSSTASSPAVSSPTELVLPVARVRKTIRLDPAVGNISKEGLHLVAKATEAFMAMLAERAWGIGRQDYPAPFTSPITHQQTSAMTGRKSVKPCDIADFVFVAPEMYWLRDEFRSERSSVRQSSSRLEGGGDATSAKKAGRQVVTGAGAITSFFKKS